MRCRRHWRCCVGKLRWAHLIPCQAHTTRAAQHSPKQPHSLGVTAGCFCSHMQRHQCEGPQHCSARKKAWSSQCCFLQPWRDCRDVVRWNKWKSQLCSSRRSAVESSQQSGCGQLRGWHGASLCWLELRCHRRLLLQPLRVRSQNVCLGGAANISRCWRSQLGSELATPQCAGIWPAACANGSRCMLVRGCCSFFSMMCCLLDPSFVAGKVL